jgi:hypothetical protein
LQGIYLAIDEKDEFGRQQSTIYFKRLRYAVMPQGQPAKSCPEESSTLLTMAETARLLAPMRP